MKDGCPYEYRWVGDTKWRPENGMPWSLRGITEYEPFRWFRRNGKLGFVLKDLMPSVRRLNWVAVVFDVSGNPTEAFYQEMLAAQMRAKMKGQNNESISSQ